MCWLRWDDESEVWFGLGCIKMHLKTKKDEKKKKRNKVGEDWGEQNGMVKNK